MLVLEQNHGRSRRGFWGKVSWAGCTMTSKSDKDYEHFREQQRIRDAAFAERAANVLHLVESRLTTVAEEIAGGYIGVEANQHKRFSEDWEEFRIYVTDHQVEGKSPCEIHFRSLCEIAQREVDWEIFATSTKEYAASTPFPGRGKLPTDEDLEKWAANAIYRRLVELAVKQTKAIRNKYDHGVLHDLIWHVRSLKAIARDASSLIGLGEAMETFEKFKKGQTVDLFVKITCGYLDDFEDGETVCVSIIDDDIALSLFEGLDDPKDLSVDEEGFETWRDALERILKEKETNLTVERDLSR